MTARATTRPLLCLLLVLSLGSQVLAVAAPAGDRHGWAEFRGVAPSATALLTRGSTRPDHARQRPSAPALFTLVPLHDGNSDPGRLAAAVECHAPRSLWIAGVCTGRSPPVIS